eukprot:CAMPEP_0117762968 /NCGR_PEP_ID=MMETSP0947-20121206/18311_1 /TAXON_ID=44440 /ORGANISM="Chattonella subsalsa, Strain CCMP2191" /LENGTH=417 /DNA_ID=CAMNT_0005584491 /DNA_START=201 /DNA_END=1454 /DNA_ORIENTATION=-
MIFNLAKLFVFMHGLPMLYASFMAPKATAASSVQILSDPLIAPSLKGDVIQKDQSKEKIPSYQAYNINSRRSLARILLSRIPLPLKSKRKFLSKASTQIQVRQKNENDVLKMEVHRKGKYSFQVTSNLFRRLFLKAKQFCSSFFGFLVIFSRKMFGIFRSYRSSGLIQQTEDNLPHNFHSLLFTVKKQIDQIDGLKGRALAAGMKLDDAEIKRWLLALEWNTHVKNKPLAKYMESTILWREKVKPSQISAQSLFDILQTKPIYINGLSRQNNPIIYYRPASVRSFQNFEKLFIYTVEQAIASMTEDVERFIVILDLKGMKMKHVPPVSVLRSTTDALNNYPGRPQKFFVMNCGSTTGLVWRIVKPFLSSRVTNMIHFVSSIKKERIVHRYISPDQLETSVGGKNPVTFDPVKGIVVV